MAERGRALAHDPPGREAGPGTTLAPVGRMRMAPVAQDLTDFEAKVMTARLGADGILWELRGIVDSMYPLGGIDVLVPVEELDAARQSLLADDVGPAPHPAPTGGGPVGGDRPDAGDAVGHTDRPVGSAPGGPTPRRWWLTAAVIVGVAVFSATRLAAAVAWLQEGGQDGCSARAASEGLATRCRP